MMYTERLRRLITLVLVLISVIHMSSATTVTAQHDQVDPACADLTPVPLVVGEQARCCKTLNIRLNLKLTHMRYASAIAIVAALL